jgi:hypothetical protein
VVGIIPACDPVISVWVWQGGQPPARYRRDRTHERSRDHAFYVQETQQRACRDDQLLGRPDAGALASPTHDEGDDRPDYADHPAAVTPLTSAFTLPLGIIR